MRGILSAQGSEENPLVEDECNEVSKETQQKDNLGNELAEDVDGTTEVPRQKNIKAQT